MVRREELQSRIHETLARLVGLRQAREEINQAVEQALDDLIDDLAEGGRKTADE